MSGNDPVVMRHSRHARHATLLAKAREMPLNSDATRVKRLGLCRNVACGGARVHAPVIKNSSYVIDVSSDVARRKSHAVILRPVQLRCRAWQRASERGPNRQQVTNVVVRLKEEPVVVRLKEREAKGPVLELVLVTIEQVCLRIVVYSFDVPVEAIRFQQIVVVKECQKVSLGGINARIGVLGYSTVSVKGDHLHAIVPQSELRTGATERGVLRGSVHQNELKTFVGLDKH